MKKTILIYSIIAVSLIATSNVQSQDKDTLVKAETQIDEPSWPEKGKEHLYAFIGKEMKYPKQARKSGVEGSVYIEFIVNKSGIIENPKVVRGIGAGCDKEALRAFTLYTDKWTLPKHNGKVVKQKIVLPVSFKLGKETKMKEDKS
jgi:TonB family protein